MSSITLIHADRSGERVTDRMAPGAPARTRLPLPIAALLGWIGAALGIYAIDLGAQGPFAGLPRALLGLVKIALIFGAGWAYAKGVRGASTDLVLSTGLAWLVFSIGADVVTGIRSTTGAYQLLGDPLAPLRIRDLTMLAWLAGPALFTRRGFGDQRIEETPRQR